MLLVTRNPRYPQELQQSTPPAVGLPVATALVWLTSLARRQAPTSITPSLNCFLFSPSKQLDSVSRTSKEHMSTCLQKEGRQAGLVLANNLCKMCPAAIETTAQTTSK